MDSERMYATTTTIATSSSPIGYGFIHSPSLAASVGGGTRQYASKVNHGSSASSNGDGRPDFAALSKKITLNKGKVVGTMATTTTTSVSLELPTPITFQNKQCETTSESDISSTTRPSFSTCDIVPLTTKVYMEPSVCNFPTPSVGWKKCELPLKECDSACLPVPDTERGCLNIGFVECSTANPKLWKSCNEKAPPVAYYPPLRDGEVPICDVCLSKVMRFKKKKHGDSCDFSKWEPEHRVPSAKCMYCCLGVDASNIQLMGYAKHMPHNACILPICTPPHQCNIPWNNDSFVIPMPHFSTETHLDLSQRLGAAHILIPAPPKDKSDSSTVEEEDNAETTTETEGGTSEGSGGNNVNDNIAGRRGHGARHAGYRHGGHRINYHGGHRHYPGGVGLGLGLGLGLGTLGSNIFNPWGRDPYYYQKGPYYPNGHPGYNYYPLVGSHQKQQQQQQQHQQYHHAYPFQYMYPQEHTVGVFQSGKLLQQQQGQQQQQQQQHGANSGSDIPFSPEQVKNYLIPPTLLTDKVMMDGDKGGGAIIIGEHLWKTPWEKAKRKANRAYKHARKKYYVMKPNRLGSKKLYSKHRTFLLPAYLDPHKPNPWPNAGLWWYAGRNLHLYKPLMGFSVAPPMIEVLALPRVTGPELAIYSDSNPDGLQQCQGIDSQTGIRCAFSVSPKDVCQSCHGHHYCSQIHAEFESKKACMAKYGRLPEGGNAYYCPVTGDVWEY